MSKIPNYDYVPSKDERFVGAMSDGSHDYDLYWLVDTEQFFFVCHFGREGVIYSMSNSEDLRESIWEKAKPMLRKLIDPSVSPNA